MRPVIISQYIILNKKKKLPALNKSHFLCVYTVYINYHFKICSN